MEGSQLCGLDEHGQGTYTAVGIKAIASAIAVSPSLTECDLRNNDLGDVGWCAVFEALLRFPRNKISNWELDNQGISSTIAMSLGNYMANSASLTSIDLFGNYIDDEGAKYISEGIAGSSSLTALTKLGLYHTLEGHDSLWM